MRNLILALPLLLTLVPESYSQALPDLPLGMASRDVMADSTSGARVPSPAAWLPAGLEGRIQGNHVVLDWTAAARPPAEFRILHPGGRLIATRLGRRSVQGWMSTVRVAGWPRGVYLAEVRSGDLVSSTRFLVP